MRTILPSLVLALAACTSSSPEAPGPAGGKADGVYDEVIGTWGQPGDLFPQLTLLDVEPGTGIRRSYFHSQGIVNEGQYRLESDGDLQEILIEVTNGGYVLSYRFGWYLGGPDDDALYLVDHGQTHRLARSPAFCLTSLDCDRQHVPITIDCAGAALECDTSNACQQVCPNRVPETCAEAGLTCQLYPDDCPDNVWLFELGCPNASQVCCGVIATEAGELP